MEILLSILLAIPFIIWAVKTVKNLPPIENKEETIEENNYPFGSKKVFDMEQEFLAESKEVEEGEDEIGQKPSEERKSDLKSRYAKLSPENIVVHSELDAGEKNYILMECHNYTDYRSREMIEIADKQIEKRRLKQLSRKISRKVTEKYGSAPFNDRESISEDVQNQVWNRDGGKCVKCSSQEKLEFDHIIPISKGGSNTARNIQLLCEKCNREKSNNIG